MVMKNVANRRCIMKGDTLVQKRALKQWVLVLMDENLDLNEHSQIAENHFIARLASKYFHAWNGVLRARGRMNRMREKLFFVWARWAATERRLKLMREDLEEWLRMRLKRRTLDAMFDIGYKFISKRITKLRRLKEVARDRRVAVCAYAIVNLDVHVIYVDCWRRWKLHFANVARWKSVAWNFQVRGRVCVGVCARARARARARRRRTVATLNLATPCILSDARNAGG